MGTDLLIPGALVSNTTERSANASVVSASLALAACPDEDDELALLDELLDDELVEEELVEDELLEDELLDDELVEEELVEDELLEDELLEDELLEDDSEVPPHPLSTTAKTARVKFRDFIIRSKRSLC
jgi:hypothetical protein